jgi:hypothetical protein
VIGFNNKCQVIFKASTKSVGAGYPLWALNRAYTFLYVPESVSTVSAACDSFPCRDFYLRNDCTRTDSGAHSYLLSTEIRNKTAGARS